MSDEKALEIFANWDGDAFVPAGAVWKQRANERFVVGERYVIEVKEVRSEASHRQYFAAIRAAFMNNDAIADRFQNTEALRKYVLIKAGYRDERSIACASKAEAGRLAAFIKPMDDFAIVTVTGAVVTVYTAKSQSMRAMGKKEFQASKDAVLNVLADMIGTSKQALADAGKAA